MRANETINIWIETTGKNLADFTASPSTLEWLKLCPEEAPYMFTRNTEDRNPLCKQGVIKVQTSKMLEINTTGMVDVDNETDQFLHANQEELDNVLVLIEDTLMTTPLIYVAEVTVGDLNFSRAGGSTVEFTFNGSSGLWKKLTTLPTPPAPVAP